MTLLCHTWLKISANQDHFWARGYFVNTVGLDEEVIRRYVKYQEDQEKRREREHGDYNLFK